MVMLKAKASDWAKTVNTDTNGEFQLNAVPLGDYSISVASPGFAQTVQDVTVIGGLYQWFIFSCRWHRPKKKSPSGLGPDRSHRQRDSHHSRGQHKHSAHSGADRTNSLAMITDYYPALTSLTTCSTCVVATRGTQEPRHTLEQQGF